MVVGGEHGLQRVERAGADVTEHDPERPERQRGDAGSRRRSMSTPAGIAIGGGLLGHARRLSGAAPGIRGRRGYEPLSRCVTQSAFLYIKTWYINWCNARWRSST